jgi:hypothetical protein
MSQLKRNTEFHFAASEKPADEQSPGIDQSQPWKTLEMKRALAAWQSGEDAGCDPYNTIGSRAIRQRVA